MVLRAGRYRVAYTAGYDDLVITVIDVVAHADVSDDRHIPVAT